MSATRAKASTGRERVVGTRVLRKEGRLKVEGRAQYVDDLRFPGMLHGVTVRSDVPRGWLLGVHLEGDDVPWDEIVVVRAQDIPGSNVVTLIVDDQPFLAEDIVRHVGEPVLLLAHADKGVVEKARRAVRLEIEEVPAVLDLRQALEPDAPMVWGSGNVLKRLEMSKGDADPAWDSVWAGADHIVEGEYETGGQEQLYIEPQGVIAIADAESVTVWGSVQCPYYVHKALGPLLDVAPERVRVVQTTTGGGFGGKEEYPSILAGHAALLARKAGRPVKMIYDRAEDMAVTPKRHPSLTKLRAAVSSDGRLLALDIDFVLDGGAYATISSVVLSRGLIHAAGPYRCDHVRAVARAVATSTPPYGAFRGFGAPQSCFALERHLDKIARVVGLEPDELRRRNLLRPGDTTATGQVVDQPIDLPALLGRALTTVDWDRKRAAFAAHNADPGHTTKKGLGVATFFHGSGFTGSGEVRLASVVGVRATREGRVEVLAASTEIGQGTNTIFAQIAADAAGVPYDQVDVLQPDTDVVPDSGPTVASRTVMVVGKLVERAAGAIPETLQRAGLLGEAYEPADFAAACARYFETHDALEASARYQPPPGITWDEATYRGAAYAAYAWAAYVAEVSVDTVTWEAQVDDFVAVQDIGTVVHPLLAAGQIEGGVAQAIGYALTERVLLQQGRMVNGTMTNYIMPTAVDLPPIRVLFEEVPFEHGPSGAKGVGELPHDGPAPAVVNAVAHALGFDVDAIPATPELLLDLAERHTAGSSES